MYLKVPTTYLSSYQRLIKSKMDYSQELEKITVTLAERDNGLCSKSDVDIEFDSESFLRKKCSKIQENLEKFIEDGWTKKTESNPR